MDKNIMKLLIITQKVDKNDDLLGFFHGWINEFAKQCQQVTVICLYMGKYDLPKNVKVLSLGKEKRLSKILYLYNFYCYIIQERKNYTHVFVHMNPIYVLLGGLFWRLNNKKIALWYNHRKGGSIMFFIAHFINKIFYTAKSSFTSHMKKSIMMPAGIDTEKFTINKIAQREPNSILFLGRISPVKNIHMLIVAAKILDVRGINFKITICGDTTERDRNYYKQIFEESTDLVKRGKIFFIRGVTNMITPELYSKNEIFVNLTKAGSFDKTILESILCGCFPIICNKDFGDIFHDSMYKAVFFNEKNIEDLANKLESAIKIDQNTRESFILDISEKIKQQHSIEILTDKLFEEIK